MSKINFMTTRGAKIEIREDKYGIAAVINGDRELRSIQLSTHAQHGLCIETTLGQSIIIPVPAEAAAEVSKLFADNAAAVKASRAEDQAYEARVERIRRNMEG